MAKRSPQHRKVTLTIQGKKHRFPTLIDACRYFKIPYVPFYARIRKGWTIRKALLTPLRPCKPRAYVPLPKGFINATHKASQELH